MARSDRTARIAAAVERELGVPGLGGRLAALDGSALGSLLLHVVRVRTAATSVRDICARATRPLHRASTADARLQHRFDMAALDAAAAFEALDLPPVLPLGACAVLAGIDPNNVLTALRGAEVIADPTVAMALEAATRRRAPAARRGGPVALCASARLVRLQPVDVPGFTPHFRLFALATAGRDAGGQRFETNALRDHALAWLGLAARLRELGFRIGRATVEVSDLAAVEAILAALRVDVAEVRAVAAAHRVGAAADLLSARGVELPPASRDPRRDLGALHARLPADAALRLDRVCERVLPAIAVAFPDAEVRVDLARLEGLGYYPGLALRIRLDGPAGPLPVVDGGFTDWTQRLLADAKERFLASAIGAELVCKLYAPPAPGAPA